MKLTLLFNFAIFLTAFTSAAQADTLSETISKTLMVELFTKPALKGIPFLAVSASDPQEKAGEAQSVRADLLCKILGQKGALSSTVDWRTNKSEVIETMLGSATVQEEESINFGADMNAEIKYAVFSALICEKSDAPTTGASEPASEAPEEEASVVVPKRVFHACEYEPESSEEAHDEPESTTPIEKAKETLSLAL